MPPLESPNPETLRLGAGQLFFARWDATGALTNGFKHLGNLDSLEITITPDVLTKRSTMTKGRPIYKKVTRSIDTVLRAVGDEWSMRNLAIAFMGNVTDRTVAATPVADQILMAAVPAGTLGAVLGGSFFFTGVPNIGAVTMDLGSTALTSADFEVYNAQHGVVRIKEGSTVVVSGTDDLTISFTPEAITAGEAPVIHGAVLSEVQGSLVYFEDNAAGENHILRAWNASVTPDGAMGLISDDFGTFTLSFALQDDSNGLHGGSVTSPLFDYEFAPEPAA